jgi:CRISPR-associated protein Csd1
MLLQRLIEYADRSADNDHGVVPAFYERKPVRWVLNLDNAGRPVGGLEDQANPDDPDRRFGTPRLIPRVSRTVAISPALGADNLEYVLGWIAEDSNSVRVPKQHAAFRQLVFDWAVAEPDDPVAAAVAGFYRSGAAAGVRQPDKWGRADLVALRVGGVFACETASARRFWAEVAGGRKGLGRSGLCLVHGGVGALLKTVPQQIERRWLPGASQGAALVSINEAVHGYELQKFLGNTPICVDCGLKFMSTLTGLLSNPRHSVSLSGQGSRLIWWLTGGRDDDIMTMLDTPDETQVRQVLASVAGNHAIDADASEVDSYFCSATLSGNVARVVVRDWVEMPLAGVYRNILAWHDDHEIIDAWTGQVTRVAMTQLVRVSGRWQPGRGGSAGSWAKFGGSGEDRPADVHRALLRAALLGRPLPPRLSTHILHRIRADARVDTARVALLRLALRRRPSTRNPEVYTPMLNPDNRDPAYVSGRIFAALEALQESFAHISQQSLNVTFTDRHFARAITAPRTAIVAGQRTANAWVKRIRRTRAGLARMHQDRLDSLFNLLDGPGKLPVVAAIGQQEAFVVGYHHQRAAIRAERAARSATAGPDAPAPDTLDPVSPDATDASEGVAA